MIKAKEYFNKASQTYDQVAFAQRESAIFLIKKLLEQNIAAKNILDVGTGTGNLIEILLKYYPHSNFYLNDISPNMLNKCKEKFNCNNNIKYIEGDMLTTDLPEAEIIVSNFALQWSNNLQTTLNYLLNKNPKVFAFSTLLSGTFFEWNKLLKLPNTQSILPYPNQDDCIRMCNNIKNNYKFNYWQQNIKLDFSTPLEFLYYLKKLGALANNISVTISDLKKIAKIAQPFHTHYRVFFGLFIEE
ncbi:methyltransferase domain-containing protein [Bartonella sp. DGB1]|uniref:methyltransferase domain-containing protein n=1 Tax=Bartonella sp. DGB1 TaxID=3239807 RepID=UPI0035267849